jgi:chloride channel protein, CIC family
MALDFERTVNLSRFRLWAKTPLWRHTVLLSVLVGIVAGIGAILFTIGLDKTSDFLMVRGAGYVMPRPGAEGGTAIAHLPTRRWLLVILPAIGGLLSGLLVYTFAPEAEGHGTDALIDAFHRRHGVIRARVPFIKTFASILTIGSGGSAGREGPIAQIGAGFGSALAMGLKTSERERRLLMLAGASAGIGAVFRAPLGGALFVAEVLYRDMEFESAALVLGFIASIIAYSLYCWFNGVWGPIFRVPDLQFTHPLELVMYGGLGVLCAGFGTIYVKVFYGIRDKIFHPMRLPNHFKPAIGGLMVGIIGWFLPQALGMGYGWTQNGIDGTLPLRLAISLLLVKIVTTGLTISSGGSGGVFAPSIVIGGCLGTAVGTTLHHFMPNVVTQPAAFVLVGMAGFFAGVAKAPISSLVMVSEMTMGYGLLVPLMLTAAVSYLLMPRSISIYEKQVNSRADSPAHEGEFMRDVLEHIRVKDVLKSDGKMIVFNRNTPLVEILDAVAPSGQQVFPIVREDSKLDGVIDPRDLSVFLTERDVAPPLCVAYDLRSSDVGVITMEEDLASALRKLYAVKLEAMPVVDSEESGKVVAILGRRNIIAAYHDQMYKAQET